MTTLAHTTRTRLLALTSFTLLALSTFSHALNDFLRITKSVDRSEAQVPWGETFTYTLQYSVVSTTESAHFATITDVLPSNVELVSVTTSTHVTMDNYNATFNMVSFTMISPLPAGSTGQVRIQARFKSNTLEGATASNTAGFLALNSLPRPSNTVVVTARVPVATGTPGVTVQKTSSGNVYGPYPFVTYWISHGNTGGPGNNVTNYVIEDPLPVGITLEQIQPDRYYGTNQNVYVKYKTNLRPGAWIPWQSGVPQWNTGTGGSYLYVSSLGLAVGEFITHTRFEYGNVPGAAGLNPDNLAYYLTLYARVTDPALVNDTQNYRNCATVTANHSTGVYTETSCTDLWGVNPQPYYDFSLWDSSNSAPHAMGETFRVSSYIYNAAQSSTALENPSLYFLLPPEFDYVGNPTISGDGWIAAGSPVPTFESIPNYKGTGRTLLRWKWNALTIPASGNWHYLDIDYDVAVKPNRVPDSWYYVDMYADWAVAWDHWNESTDALDIDGDGNHTETLPYRNQGFHVQTGDGTAALDAVMWVKGELDAGFTNYPTNGQTSPSGRLDYELRVTNPSGVLLDNLVVIDILPHVGDFGVLDLSPRNSQWSPFLVGPVAAPPGSTVYYSISKNPCRDELTPGIPVGCEPPNWNTNPPADITTVKSLKFDFTGTYIYPGDTMTIAWPMAAPANAPMAGEIAWNSFGFKARTADSGVELLPSEPFKTGIAVRPPNPPFYGDFVWNDVNQNGLQDAGEPGINGIRVELYRDDNGDNISDPTVDTFIQFNVTANNGVRDGAYLFGNLTAGNYFAVVVPGAAWAPTRNDVGADNAVDSDGVPSFLSGARAGIMPVTTLDPLEEDRSWDVGVYDRSGQPAVWAIAQFPNGNMMLGGRFNTSHGLARKNIVMVNSAGTPIPTFAPGAGFDGDVRSIAIDAGGNIFVGGSFTKYKNIASYGLALIKPNGAIAKTLAIPDRNTIRWVAAGADGLYFSGAFNKVGTTNRRNIARLKADGSLDSAFNTSVGADGPVYCGAIQTNRNLIIAGAFTNYAGVNRGRVARITPTGALDTTFDPGAGANGDIFSLKLLTDGRVVLTGSFTQFSGQTCNGTIRLMPNGTVDPTLAPSALEVESIQSSN